MPSPDRTHPIIWGAAIICGVVMVSIIVVSILAVIGYLTIKPKVPEFGVPRAELDTIYYNNLYNFLWVNLTVVIKATNGNVQSAARFTNMHYGLTFRGRTVAELATDPFEVEANKSIELNYVVHSSSMPISSLDIEAVELALSQGTMDFELRGAMKTTWKIWLFGSVKYWLYVDCELHLPTNGTAIYTTDCISRK